MRHSGIIAALVLSFVLCGHVVPCYPASTSQYSREYSKNFYRSLSRRLSKNRADYSRLSDAEFVNFREIHTTGIAPGKLFRSSSPISTWGNRNTIADRLSELAGIRTFINLTDTNQGMKEHNGYSGSYYSRQKVIGLNVNLKFSGSRFRKGLARGIHFMAVNEPPYLIHCSLGKDRAGFTCAVVECLMGAGSQEVTADYLVSFYNYFGILPGSKEYDFVANAEVRRFLAEAFGVESIDGVNLSESAERYLLSIGVSRKDISALRQKLSPPSE